VENPWVELVTEKLSPSLTHQEWGGNISAKRKKRESKGEIRHQRGAGRHSLLALYGEKVFCHRGKTRGGRVGKKGKRGRVSAYCFRSRVGYLRTLFN